MAQPMKKEDTMGTSELQVLKKNTQKFAVKNKTAAPIQITAEQLLLEAVQRQANEVQPPTVRIVDEEELQNYRVRKRKEYEDTLRRQRHHLGTWIAYAQWEATQKEFVRARSIFERALNIDYQNISLWLKYIEMETRNKFINSARNLYDRVCQLLPRVDQFWFKYAHMEELLGNYAGARNVFERWMEWNPEDKGWMMFIRFEERCGEIDRCRSIFERYLSYHPTQEAFLRFSKFEEQHKNYIRARAGFEKAIELLPFDMLDEAFYIKFAQFEERQREMERVKIIYEQALKRLAKDKSEELYKRYVSFQKQHGDRDTLEETVLMKRRQLYETGLEESGHQYDLWIDYIRLEENTGDVERIRDVYERAISNIPPIQQKRYWKRYIYLWINYVLFEELQTADIRRCRAIYDKLIKLIPHKIFSFAKIWQLYAQFELRQLNLELCRKIYGRGIAECGKEKIFNNYSSLELRLGNIDRCRKIFAKFIELHPFNPKYTVASTVAWISGSTVLWYPQQAWISLIELEIMAEEIERARRICEMAVSMEQMDMPELIWKTYIDLETNAGELEFARNLYERLLEKTQHFKAFKSYAEFEFRQRDSVENARGVLERGLRVCKEAELNEERALLLEHWMQMEREHADPQFIEAVFRRQPKKVRRKRQLFDEEGNEQGWEEFITYIFPDDGAQTANLKILEAARNWKKKMESLKANDAAAA